jgi:hypothetical protein
MDEIPSDALLAELRALRQEVASQRAENADYHRQWLARAEQSYQAQQQAIVNQQEAIATQRRAVAGVGLWRIVMILALLVIVIGTIVLSLGLDGKHL